MRHILLIEDSEDDRTLFAQALARNGVPAALKTVNNGRQAIDYLEGTDVFADRSQYPVPDIIVCDLRMPGNGFEFLKWRKTSPFLCVPVVVLEGTGKKVDHDRARALGCDLVFEKPTDSAILSLIVKEIASFGLNAE